MLKLKPRKTVEDFMNLPEGTLAELIGGELLMTPSPRSDHQYVVGEIFAALREAARRSGAGRVFMAPLDVHLPSGDVVEPDVVFVRESNAGIVREWIHGAPDLLVEVLSPDRPERDRLTKRDLYARHGVPEYWIIEPPSRTVEVYRLDGGSYPQPALYEASDHLVAPMLPALSLPVASLFPAA